MFDDLVDCKRILRETAIMTRPLRAFNAFGIRESEPSKPLKSLKIQ